MRTTIIIVGVLLIIAIIGYNNYNCTPIVKKDIPKKEMKEEKTFSTAPVAVENVI